MNLFCFRKSHPPPPVYEGYKVYCPFPINRPKVSRSFPVRKKNASSDFCMVFSNKDLKAFPCQNLKYGNAVISMSFKTPQTLPHSSFLPADPCFPARGTACKPPAGAPGLLTPPGKSSPAGKDASLTKASARPRSLSARSCSEVAASEK